MRQQAGATRDDLFGNATDWHPHNGHAIAECESSDP